MKELWIEIEESMPLETKKALIEIVQNTSNTILCDKPNISLAKAYGVRVASPEGGDIAVIDESKITVIEEYLKPICLRIKVQDRIDEEKTVSAVKKGIDYVAIKCPNWKVIPIENIIAKIHGNAKILAEVTNSNEAKVALETLELGVDGILLKTLDLKEATATLKLFTNLNQEEQGKKIKLSLAKIIECKQLGMGFRVCIDTCDIMNLGEGMLVGCSSVGLFLVQAEVKENPHVAPRPFRVNAGPVSLYIFTPDNVTRYLSELRTGDEITVVDRNGFTRRAIVGRIKIERRPMILIEAEIECDRIKTIVQNAETIHFVTQEGSKSVADLRADDEVLVLYQKGGRHFGTLVEEETTLER